MLPGSADEPSSGSPISAQLLATKQRFSSVGAQCDALISNLEKRRLIRKQKVLAVKLVQARFRHWRAVRKRQRTKEAVSPQPHDVQRKPSMRARTGYESPPPPTIAPTSSSSTPPLSPRPLPATGRSSR